MVGRQQLDLDFFRKALRLADALSPETPAHGAKTLRARPKLERERGAARQKPTPAHDVQHLCQIAQLSRAGYYRRLGPHETRREADLRDAIQRIALQDRHYGYRRVAEQLRREGVVVNAKRCAG